MVGGKAKKAADTTVYKCWFKSENGNDLIVYSMRCTVLMPAFHKDDRSLCCYSLNNVLPLYF